MEMWFLSFQLLYLLRQYRLTDVWLLSEGRQKEHAHAMLMALRLLLRDEQFQQLLMKGEIAADPLLVLRKLLTHLVEVHFSPTSATMKASQLTTDLLKETTS